MNNKYIKKSVEIEAIQWNGNNLEEIMKFLNSEFSYEKNTEYVTKKFSYYQTSNNLYINTLEGEMKATIGDYIIKGIKGEYYPCKPDIFELTYAQVYTLEEIKKEWEELGYEWEKREHIILIYNRKIDKMIGINTMICSYGSYNSDGESSIITFQEHQLLTKTFKALGWYDE